MPPVRIKLTWQQREDLKDCHSRIHQMSNDKKPGMLLAQIYGGEMVAGVVSYENAKKIVAAMGGEMKNTSSPDDRKDVAATAAPRLRPTPTAL